MKRESLLCLVRAAVAVLLLSVSAGAATLGPSLQSNLGALSDA